MPKYAKTTIKTALIMFLNIMDSSLFNVRAYASFVLIIWSDKKVNIEKKHASHMYSSFCLGQTI